MLKQTVKDLIINLTSSLELEGIKSQLNDTLAASKKVELVFLDETMTCKTVQQTFQSRYKKALRSPNKYPYILQSLDSIKLVESDGLEVLICTTDNCYFHMWCDESNVVAIMINEAE